MATKPRSGLDLMAGAGMLVAVRVFAIPYSTNVERVTLALEHKRLPYELVLVDPADRTPVRAISGQDLVPVLVDDDGTVVHDSTAILLHLEARHPDPPLFPRDPARRAEMEVFIDWFNRVWKRPPNEIEALERAPDPDRARIEALGAEMTAALDRFEALLSGRPYLFGTTFSAPDCAAWPFLRYATLRDPADEEPFHLILERFMPLGRNHPRLAAWIERIARSAAAG